MDDADVTDEAEKKRRKRKERASSAAPPPCYRRNPWLVRFRCQRGDDVFKARIAAQRIPPGQQLQVAITDSAAGKADGTGKLFAGESSITNRCSDSSQAHDHTRPVGHILFYRKQLNGASALAQGFLFAPQCGVD